ncbi:CCR4-NOT transcription complex subunit 10-like isoform X1 [Salvia hispanica]|uniref:CCR4-NOT transcription complex subunit 10-like isoform X1 n=1 Tax=Salvia hispanica TaxID=49212 RepID=UPI0020098BDC|nr:CCR4-NOT transcription complex subunit 10-like isoform X1 [Salvia hispanica]
MDSPSSSLTLNTRDGSPSAEGLAKEAAVLFQSGMFADCLRVLNQLLQKEDHPKVRHNIAIAESLQGGCSDPRRLIKALEKIKEQSEELACASGEHLEVSSNNGSEHTSSITGNSAPQHPISSFVHSYEFDTSVATYNIAVIWYHLHEFARSFSYLDTLYQTIEPIREGTALCICLLLLDVALLSHNASRSADVISYMEKVYVSSVGNQVDNGSLTHQQSLLVSKSTSFSNNSTLQDGSHPDSTSDNSLTRTLSEEALEDEHLQLLSSLDISGQNLQRPGIVSANDLQRIQPEGLISTADLKLKLRLYKVRFLLLTRNLKAAKREVKIAMNLIRGKDYPLALYLKSQLEYVCGNHRKAIKLLMASTNSIEMGFSSMYYNDLGCICYRLGKHHTSGVFFSKALSYSSAARKEKPPKLLTLSQDKSLLIMYNCGVQSLARGRPVHAARCFQKASLIFYNRPLLWLRIAECCLMALDKGLIKSSAATAISEIEANVIGRGKWRQLALRYGSSTGQGRYVGMDSSITFDGKHPDLSMSLARQSLVNALFLLDSSDTNYFRAAKVPGSEENESGEAPLSPSSNVKNATGGDPKAPTVASSSSPANANSKVKEHTGGKNLGGTLDNSIPDYEHIRLKENLMIRQAVLADLAFVELALGDPSKALSTARSLLKLPDCSKMYIFLGTMYAAEALCLLNRPKEAAEHLAMYMPDGNNIKLPYSQDDCEKWTVEKVADTDESHGGTIGDESLALVFSSPEEARGLFCANFAAHFALQGDFEQAERFLTNTFSDIPNSSQAILTAIYVDIKRGKTQDALAKLRHHRGIRFHN